MFLWPPGNIIIERVQANNERQTIAAIERLYEKYNPGFPFTFNFLDRDLKNNYKSELE